MAVNATINVTRVSVQKQGRKGLPGDNGTDGIGINTVRMSKLNNPVFHAFKKNLIVKSLFGVMSVTRSTNGSLQDRSGIIKNVLPDIPREYGSGWLIEGASTNLLTFSEQFDNAAWTKTNVTITADSTDSPDLTTTGDTLTQTVASGSVSDSVTITSDLLIKTASLFLKEGTAPTTTLRLSLSGGTPVSADTDITWSTIDSNVNAERLGDGWYRVKVELANNTNTTATIEIFPDTSDSSLTVIAWGGQLEQNVLSSYIKTVGAIATRTIDSITTDVFGNIPDLTKPWSFFASIKTSALDSYIFEHENSQFGLLIDSTSHLVISTNSGTTFALTGVIDFSLTKELSLDFDGSNLRAWIDGTEELTVVPLFNTASDGSIRYGNNFAGTQPSYCQILDARWYDFNLNDSENEFLAV